MIGHTKPAAKGPVMSKPRTIKTIGFVGLGRMGYPMAGHLAKAGYEVVAYDINPEALARFTAEHDCASTQDLKSLGSQSDAVITMLPTSSIVRDVVLGEGGVAAGLEAGKIVIDMSTSNPNDTRSLGRALNAKDIHVVDAPVAGGVVFAKDASLDILTAGDKAVVDHLSPIFEAIGQKNHYCGALGSAHALKAFNNYINAAVLGVYIEALVAGLRFGIDLETLLQSVEAATLGRNHPFEKKVKTHILTRKFATGMAMSLIAKDVRIAVDTMQGLGVPAPLAETTAHVWEEASQKIGADLDQTDIVKFWEQPAEVQLKLL